MNAAIHVELTSSGDQFVLIAAGVIDDIAYAAKQLGAATPAFAPSTPPGALTCPASWPAAVQLAATYGPHLVIGPRMQAWLNTQTTARTSDYGALSVDVPDGLTPWPHQVEGAKMIAATGRALIFDEPRTGKTITAIIGLAERQLRGLLDGPILVICPAAVIDPWVEAIEDWAPYWRAIAWAGANRAALIGTADVYVASYEAVTRDTRDTNPTHSPLIRLNPAAVVVDECHMTKTQSSKRSLAVRRVARNAKAFVATSGTPITHHPANLWPTLVSFAPGAWPARERWVNRYCLQGVAEYGESILGLHPGTAPEFRLTILGQHRRVARDDLGWAPKSYEVRTVELPPEHRAAYDQFEADMLAELPDGQELAVMDVLSQLSFLRRLACSAADVEVTYEVDDEGVEKRHVSLHHKWPSWKIDELLAILAERGGAPSIAFAVSKPLALMAGEAATAAGRKVGYIVGGQTRKKRTETRRAFQRGDLDLVCATVSAGGVGITLNRAEDLIFIERPWSLVDSIQAEDRGVGDINAPGCNVIDIIANRTIDTRVRAVLRERAGQLADLVQDPRVVAQLLGGASVTRIKNRSVA